MRNHWRGRLFAVWILLCLFLGGNMLPSVTAQTTSQWIESDDSRVTHEGEWTMQTTPQASGGAYLFSGTASPDSNILSLAFAGPSIEVWYIAGPTMGTMAIEVDGTVLRTVISTQDTTQFSQRAAIDYLSDENHTLRVYPAAGIIAVDAFYAADLYPDTVNASESVGPRVACDSDTTIHRVSISSGGVGGNNNSEIVAISGDGRYVAFESVATNLVTGDTNNQRDIFRRDRQTCTTIRVSVTNAGGSHRGAFRHYPLFQGMGVMSRLPPPRLIWLVGIPTIRKMYLCGIRSPIRPSVFRLARAAHKRTAHPLIPRFHPTGVISLLNPPPAIW